MMVRRTLAALGFAVLFAPVAQADVDNTCWIFCDTADVPADQAAPSFESDLGTTLPKGVTMIGMLEGGFQDRFIQVRLQATAKGIDALLALRGLTRTDLTDGTVFDFGPETPIWWDIKTTTNLSGAVFGSPQLAELIIGVAPDPIQPDLFAVYFFGFET